MKQVQKTFSEQVSYKFIRNGNKWKILFITSQYCAEKNNQLSILLESPLVLLAIAREMTDVKLYYGTEKKKLFDKKINRKKTCYLLESDS